MALYNIGWVCAEPDVQHVEQQADRRSRSRRVSYGGGRGGYLRYGHRYGHDGYFGDEYDQPPLWPYGLYCPPYTSSSLHSIPIQHAFDCLSLFPSSVTQGCPGPETRLAAISDGRSTYRFIKL